MDAPTEGSWDVVTETGTHYVFDFDAMTCTRTPVRDGWPHGLRRDGEPYEIRAVKGWYVGGILQVEFRPYADDVDYWTTRMTTPVVAIERSTDA